MSGLICLCIALSWLAFSATICALLPMAARVREG